MKNTVKNIQTGKIGDNVGYSTCYGVTRQLTKRELKLQRDLQKGK